jgi:hypothetical protein
MRIQHLTNTFISFTIFCLVLIISGPAWATDYSYTVDSVADISDSSVGDGNCEDKIHGNCTLRAAMEEGNSNMSSSSDTLTITLPSRGVTICVGSSLEFTSDGSLTIQGDPISDILTTTGPHTGSYIDGGNSSNSNSICAASATTESIFSITGGTSTVNFSDFIIMGGLVSDKGAGILFDDEDTLTLTDMTLKENKVSSTDSSTIYGAAVHMGGESTATITDSKFDSNSITSTGQGWVEGGAMYFESGTLSISGTKFTNNSATASTGDCLGGALHVSMASEVATTVTISDSSKFSSNSCTTDALSFGGAFALGIYSLVSADINVTIEDSTFDANSISGEGVYGGQVYLDSADEITISDSSFSNGTATATTGSQAYGGAISFDAVAAVSISKSSFTDNTVTSSASSAGSYGGALCFCEGFVSMELGDIAISQSVFSGNTATATGSSSGAFGGGIYTDEIDSIAITNSTISGNKASGASKSLGGGLFVKELDADDNLDGMKLSFVTIANNSVSGATTNTGGGFYSEHSVATSQSYAFINVLIADNSSTGTSPDCSSSDSIQSYGYNLLEIITGCTFEYATSGADVATDITKQDPGLYSLADNGGSTKTLAIDSSSVAADAGTCSDLDGNTVTVDQRDYERDASNCDIGAFEYSEADYSVDEDSYDFEDSDSSKLGGIPTAIKK